MQISFPVNISNEQLVQASSPRDKIPTNSEVNNNKDGATRNGITPGSKNGKGKSSPGYRVSQYADGSSESRPPSYHVITMDAGEGNHRASSKSLDGYKTSLANPEIFFGPQVANL